MEMDEDIHNYFLVTPESFRKLRYVPEIVEREVEAPKKRSIGEYAFITLLPLRSSRDFGDAEFRGSQGHLKVIPEGGGNLVT